MSVNITAFILQRFVPPNEFEAASSDFERWVLLDRVQSARYYDFAVPGDRIEIVVERVESDDPERRVFRAESRVDGKRGATIDFEARVVPLDSLDDPAKARRDYTQLRGEDA